MFPLISDWHINVKVPELSVGFPGQKRVSSEEDRRQARRLADTALSIGKKKPFSFVLDGDRYRATWMSEDVLVLRTLPVDVPEFDQLGIPVAYRDLLMKPQLQEQGGLVMITGHNGMGKTTTANALLKARLKAQGGYALSFDAPIEYELQGFHGDGYLEQISLNSSEDYAPALAQCLRYLPAGARSMLLIGDVPNEDAAKELFKILNNGHLVFITVDGRDVVSAVQRLCAMATAGHEDQRPQREILAKTLRLVAHQSIEQGRPKITALQVGDSAASLIANGSIPALKDEVFRTQQLLAKGF